MFTFHRHGTLPANLHERYHGFANGLGVQVHMLLHFKLTPILKQQLLAHARFRLQVLGI